MKSRRHWLAKSGIILFLAANLFISFAAAASAEEAPEEEPRESPEDIWYVETGAADYLVPIDFSSLIAAGTLAEIRGLADNYVEEREGGKILARVKVGTEDEWLALVTPEIPPSANTSRSGEATGGYQPHRDLPESIVMRVGFRYSVQEEIVEAIYEEGYRPWKMTVREGKKLRIFPIGMDFPDPVDAQEELQARLRYEHDGESAAGQEIVALMLDETTFTAVREHEKPAPAPCFVLRAGTAPYLEVEYLRDGSKVFQSFVSTAIAFATSSKNKSRPLSAR